MRIAQVAPLFESVPPALYGGTERVVAYLTAELARRGHDVTLFAAGDSQSPVELVSATKRALRLDPAATDWLAPHLVELSQVFERAADYDLIHCHVDVLALPFGRIVETPTLHTLHGRLDLPHLRPLFRYFRDAPLASVSAAQREPLDGLGLAWQATVHHGIPVSQLTFCEHPEPYLVYLGRIAPEKRPDLAIEIAKRAGLPLKIAAKIDRVDREYFEHDIRPRLDHPLIEFVGEIDEARKQTLLGCALALLFPIDWQEPFGLTLIEAMACGTPVVARPRGSVPEIVVPGQTGLLGNSLEELVEAVERIDTISRQECRRHFERCFTAARMAGDYECIYASLQMRAQTARQFGAAS